MTVTQTSKEAFEKIQPTAGSDQDQVLAVIREIGPTFDAEILYKLQLKEQKKSLRDRRLRPWAINKVTPRRGELANDYCPPKIEYLGDYWVTWEGHVIKVKLWRPRGDCRTPEQRGWIRTDGNAKPQMNSLTGLLEFRQLGRQKTTAPTEQRMLFAK